MKRVVCVLYRPGGVQKEEPNTAEYCGEWVDRLKRGFDRWMGGEEWEMHVVTDHGREEFKEEVVVHEFAWRKHVGRWMCINEVFRPEVSGDGVCVFCGLDTVISGGGVRRLWDWRAGEEGRKKAGERGEIALLSHARKAGVMANAVVVYRGMGWLWEKYMKDPVKADLESRNEGWARKQGSEMLYWWKECPWAGDLRKESPVKVVSAILEREAMEEADVIYWHGWRKPHLDDHRVVKENWV